MKEGQTLWTREELILAINLYCKLPFGKLDRKNREVIHLSELIGRTPSSVAYKLVNFASLDPSLQARGIKGAVNSSKLDKEIWKEFYNNWNELAYESEKLRAKVEQKTVEELNGIDDIAVKKGLTREQIVKVRVNQAFFRKSVLASYNSTCCITGIKHKELLIAGHIRPWGLDEKNRLNPQNGILMNALHDKAFECGLITITTDYKVKVSSSLIPDKLDVLANEFFWNYDNKSISLPEKFLPDKSFLDYHNNERFIK